MGIQCPPDHTIEWLLWKRRIPHLTNSCPSRNLGTSEKPIDDGLGLPRGRARQRCLAPGNRRTDHALLRARGRQLILVRLFRRGRPPAGRETRPHQREAEQGVDRLGDRGDGIRGKGCWCHRQTRTGSVSGRGHCVGANASGGPLSAKPDRGRELSIAHRRCHCGPIARQCRWAGQLRRGGQGTLTGHRRSDLTKNNYRTVSKADNFFHSAHSSCRAPAPAPSRCLNNETPENSRRLAARVATVP